MTAPRIGSTIPYYSELGTVVGVTESKGGGAYDLELEVNGVIVSHRIDRLARVIREAWESGEPVAVAAGPGGVAIVRRA